MLLICASVVGCNFKKRIIMTMKTFIVSILLLIPFFSFSHTMYEVKDRKYHAIADSLIESLTDSIFRESIKYQRTWECYYDISDINSKVWSGESFIVTFYRM